jgi:hypothetical protein
VIIGAGKFHDVIAANTPIGSFSTTMRRPWRSGNSVAIEGSPHDPSNAAILMLPRTAGHRTTGSNLTDNELPAVRGST